MKNTVLNLTHPQKRILFNEIVYPNEDMSNVGFIFEFKVNVLEAHIEEIINSIIKKYDALRIRITKDTVEENIVQYFEDYKKEQIDIIDCTTIENLPRYLEKVHYTKFNLYNHKLCYFAILKLKNNKKGLYMKLHHIIGDGITSQLIVKDLSDQIKQSNLYTETAPSYEEFIKCEKIYLNSNKFEKDKIYWENHLNKLCDETSLAKKEPIYCDNVIKRIDYTFSKDVFKAMKELCENKEISYFHLLSAAISIYFKQYKNESTTSIGRAIHNRKKHHFRKIAGMFVSTVPFVYELYSHDNFESIIEDIKLKLKKDMRHQEYPYDLMIQNFRKYNTKINNPINIQISETPELENELISVTEQLFSQKWNSEMLILINPRNMLKEDILEASINYLNPLFCEQDISEFLNTIENILKSCISSSTKPINEIFCLDNDIENYWQNAISKDFSKISMFPTHQYKNNYEYEKFKVDLPTHVFEKITQYSKNKNVSVSDCMMAGIFILTYNYTFKDDIIIGTPIEHASAINTLPIQIKLSDVNYDSFVDQVKYKMEQINKYGDYSVEQLIKKMNLDYNGVQNPFFNIVFSSNYNLNKKIIQDITGFDIKFDANILNDQMTLDITYRNDIFTEERIERMSKRYIYILNQVMNNHNTDIKNIKMLTESEHKMITNTFSNGSKTCNFMDTVIDGFEEIVLKNPKNIALVENDRSFTYYELNKIVNRLAHTLIKFEVKKEDIIAILLNNSIEYVISILAIMKAGATALPIDPKNPQNRIEGILENSQAKGLICLNESIEQIDFHGFSMDIKSPYIYSDNENNPPRTFGKEDLAYIIYTSGSTGIPKGVCVEHHSLVNFCLWHNKEFDINDSDRTIKYASPGFDASIWEIFTSILKGVSIYIVPEAIKLNFPVLNKFLEKNRITVCFVTTRVFEEFLELENNSLRLLLTGGDKLRRFKKKKYRLVNNYGPTENTIVSTYCVLDESKKGCIPIGRPIDNVSTWILDENMNICPIDVSGELYLGGQGVARGYLNSSDLTHEKFVTHPLFPCEKLYRSGDLVRWLPDGNIEFIGRIDDQIQLRGLRIELGEIEAQLMMHPKILNVSVKLQDAGTDYEKICAYYVSNNSCDLQNLEKFLDDKLPEYMIPKYYKRLDCLPFTNNGKLDKRKLPYINVKEIISKEKKLPSNDFEYKLLNLWNKVLKTNSENITDNFFEIGGNSLLAAIMMSRIYEKYEVNIPLDIFYKEPTIEGISDWMKDSNNHNENTSFIIYNKNANNNLFCFPSAFGNASEYFNLAKEMSSFKMYAFNLIENFTINHYINEILKVQKEGPYTFIGYSLGGILAFEAAKEMKKLGKEVSKIIMFDSYAFDLKTSTQIKCFMEDLKNNLEFDIDKVIDSVTHIVKCINFEDKIDIPITNICAQINKEQSRNYIKGLPDILTSNKYDEYQGYGLHNQMLKEGFVDKNNEILDKLL